MLTLHQSGQLVRLALEAGAPGVVLKSDLADSLVIAICRVARGEVSLTPKVSEIVVGGFVSAEKTLMPGESTEKRLTRRESELIQLLEMGKANRLHLPALKLTVFCTY